MDIKHVTTNDNSNVFINGCDDDYMVTGMVTLSQNWEWDVDLW